MYDVGASAVDNQHGDCICGVCLHGTVSVVATPTMSQPAGITDVVLSQ